MYNWTRCLPIFLFLLVSVQHIQDSYADKLPPFTLPGKKEIRRIKSAVIQTTKGDMLAELYPEFAPWHVANFKYLADKKFYNNMRFHIYEPNYVIQIGAPGKRINSGPGYTIPPEFNDISHRRGALSMVRKPNDLDREHTRRSHGSQFRIMLRDEPKLDRRFTVFGQIVDGFDVLQQLDKSDRILGITVFVRKKGHAAPLPHKYSDPPEPPPQRQAPPVVDRSYPARQDPYAYDPYAYPPPSFPR